MMFQKFYSKYGKPFDNQKIGNSELNSLSHIMPESLMTFFKEDHFGGYADGLFWTINPVDFIKYVPKWVVVGSNGIPFMRTAFGDLIVYFNKSNEDNIIFIDVRHQKRIYLCENMEELFNDVLLLDDGFFIQITKLNMFEQAYKKLGRLDNNRCYGFEPILASGGKEDVSNLKIFEYKPHLDILTQSLKEPL